MPRLSTARAQQQQSKASSAGNGTAEVTLGDSRQDIGTIEVPRNGTMRWINSGTRDLQLQFTRPGVEEDGSSSSNGMAPNTFELTVPGGGQSVKHFSRTGLYSYACETPHITGQVRVIARDKPSLLPPSIKVPTSQLPSCISPPPQHGSFGKELLFEDEPETDHGSSSSSCNGQQQQRFDEHVMTNGGSTSGANGHTTAATNGQHPVSPPPPPPPPSEGQFTAGNGTAPLAAVDEAAVDYGEHPFGHSVRRRPNAAKAASNTGPVVKGLNLTNNKLGLKGSKAAAQAPQQPQAVLGSRFEEMVMGGPSAAAATTVAAVTSASTLSTTAAVRSYGSSSSSSSSSDSSGVSNDDRELACEAVGGGSAAVCRIEHYAFHPNELRVPLNTTVVFVLADQTGAPEHQPVGECAATGKGVFRGPLMDRTGTSEFRHTFREPGDVRVRCEVVRDMQATITVTDAPAAAAAAATAAATATAETAVTDGDADVQLYVTTAGALGCCLSPRRLTLCEGQRVTICHRGGGTHQLSVTRRGARAPLWSRKPLDGVRTRKFCLPPLAPAEYSVHCSEHAQGGVISVLPRGGGGGGGGSGGGGGGSGGAVRSNGVGGGSSGERSAKELRLRGGIGSGAGISVNGGGGGSGGGSSDSSFDPSDTDEEGPCPSCRIRPTLGGNGIVESDLRRLCTVGDCGIVDGRHQRFTRNGAGETAWEPVAQRLTLDKLGDSAQPPNGDSSRGRGGVADARVGAPESVAALLRTVDSSAAAAAAAHGGGGSGALSAAEAHQLGHEARAASIVASMRQQPGGGGGIWGAAHGKWPSRLITPAAAAAAAAAAARAPSGSLSLMHMMENMLAQGRGGGGGGGAGGGSAAAAAAGGDEAAAAAAAGRKKKKKAKKKGGGAATGEEDASATTGAAALDAGASQTPVLIVATYKGLKPSRVMLVPGQPAQVVLGKRESSETQVRTISVTPVSKTKGVPAPEPSSFQLSHEKPRQGIRFPAEPGEYVLYDNVSKSRATVTVMSAAEAAAAAGGGGSGGAGDARSSEAAMEQLLKEEEKAAKLKPGKKRKQQKGATAAAVAAAPDATATTPAAATTAAEGEAATEESEAAADGETADEWAWPETQSGKAEAQEPQEPPSSDVDAETETTEDDSAAAAAEPATRAASPPPAAAAAPGGAAAHAQQRAPVVVALRSVEALPPFCASAVAYVRLGQPINPQYPPPAHFSAAFVEGEGAAVRCSLTSFSVSAGGPPREIRVFRVRASGDVGEAPEAAATVSPEGPHSCVFLLMAPGVYRVVDTRNGRSVEVTSAVPDAALAREFEWERSTKQFPVSQASRAEARQRIAATTAATGSRSGGGGGAAAEPADRRSMEEHDWALAVALHEEEEAAAGAAAGRPAEAAESWELASRTKSKQKRSGVSSGGGGSSGSMAQAQQQQQQRMHVRRPSGEMAAPVGVRGGFVVAAAAGAAASGRSSGGAGGSSGGVVNSAAWPALESRTVVRVSSAPLPSVRPSSDLSNPAVAPPASEPRQQAAAAAAPDAAQPAAVDRERSQSPVAAAADAARPATVGSPAAAAANAAQPATASRERSQSPSAAAEPALSATAQSGSSAGVGAAAAPMPAAPQSPPQPPRHEQADATAAAPIVELVSSAEAGSDAQPAEVAEQSATAAPTAPAAAAEPAVEAADAIIARGASPLAEPTVPVAIDSPPLPPPAEDSSVPSPLPLPLSSIIAFGDFTSLLTASPTFAALPPPDDSAADTVLAEGQWVLPPPTPTTTPVVAVHLSAEAAGAAPAAHGAEDGSQDRHAVAVDDGRRMGQQLLAMLQPDAAADAYSSGGDGSMGPYADVGAQYGDGSGGFMDGSGGVVYGDGSAHHMYDDGSGSMLYGGGSGGGMVYSDGSGGVAYGYDDGTGAVVYSHAGGYMDHSGGAYYGGGGGMVADSWEDRYGAPLPPLPPQHPPLPPPSAFELEHSEFLRQRWEAFQERFAAGYDVLPSGKHVPIVWVTLPPQ